MKDEDTKELVAYLRSLADALEVHTDAIPDPEVDAGAHVATVRRWADELESDAKRVKTQLDYEQARLA